MKKNKKLTKGIASIVAIASFSTSFAIASPSLVDAAEINTSEKILIEGTKTNTPDIQEWTVPLQKAAEINGKNLGANRTELHVAEDEVNYHQFSAEADGSPIITDSENIFLGRNILNNVTDQEQTLSTSAFERTIENSVTHSTTHGFNLGVTASAKFKVPFVGETGMETTVEYNFSDTSSNTTSESYTYTAPPQNIIVPAHSSVEVIVRLNTVKAKGNVKLLSKISGNGVVKNFYPMSPMPSMAPQTFYDIVNDASKHEKLKDISANSDGKTVNIIGAGTYESKYGTDFYVDVIPVDKNGKYLNEGKTYKLKPDISKN